MPRLGKKITHEDALVLARLGYKDGKDYLAGNLALRVAARNCPWPENLQLEWTEALLKGQTFQQYYLVEYEENE